VLDLVLLLVEREAVVREVGGREELLDGGHAVLARALLELAHLDAHVLLVLLYMRNDRVYYSERFGEKERGKQETEERGVRGAPQIYVLLRHSYT
jgi:hypothetical protein